MKKLKIKHIWLVILFIYYDIFDNRDVILPKDINDLEINIALFIIFVLPVLIMFIIVIILMFK